MGTPGPRLPNSFTWTHAGSRPGSARSSAASLRPITTSPLLCPCVSKILDVAVQKQTVATAEVDGFSAQRRGSRWNGVGEVGVDANLDIGRAVRIPGLRILCQLEIGHRLVIGLPPQIVQRYWIVGPVEPPQPIVRSRRVCA